MDAVIGALRVVLGMDSAAFEKGWDRANAKNKDGATGFAKVGRQFGEIGKSISDQFTSAINTASSRVPVLGEAIAGLGGPAIIATAALAGVAIALNEAGKAMDWADDFQATADHIGIAAESLQALDFAAGEADVEVSAMHESLKNLNGSLGAMLTGVGSAKIEKAFAAIGIKPDDLKGMNDASDLLPLLADRISQLGTQAERVQIARKLGIEALLPMLEDGAGGLKAMTDRAAELGLVIDGQTVESLADLNREVEIANQRIDVDMKRAFAELAPLISSCTTALADFVHELVSIPQTGPDASLWDKYRIAMEKTRLTEQAWKHGLFGADADKWVDTQMHMSRATGREKITVEGMERFAGIYKPPATTDLPGSGTTGNGHKDSELARLMASLQGEDVRLKAEYDKNVKLLSDHIKRHPEDRKAYEAALVELKREYEMASKGWNKVAAQPNEGSIGKESFDLGKLKDVDLHPLLDQLKELPTLAHPIRDAMAEIGTTIAESLGDAIAYGDDLGESLARAFRRISAEWITNGLQDIFNQMIGQKGGGNTGVFGSFLSGLIPGFAIGTNYAPGGLALVGEQGPELVNLPRGAQVINNAALQAMGGGEGIIVHVSPSEYFDARVERVAAPLAAQAAGQGASMGAAISRAKAAKANRLNLEGL